MTVLERKLRKATVSEKTVISEKIRHLSSGSEVILQNLGLVER
jgi:hypothetical protein